MFGSLLALARIYFAIIGSQRSKLFYTTAFRLQVVVTVDTEDTTDMADMVAEIVAVATDVASSAFATADTGNRHLKKVDRVLCMK